MKALCLSILLLASSLLYLDAQPYGLEARPTVGPFLNNIMPESAPAVSGKWSAVVAFSNLFFTNALGLTVVPGTSQLCVWEREGRVWTFTTDPAVSQKTLVLDITNQCQGWDDSGLLGLAFHPGFQTNHYVFIYYTWVTPGTVVGNPTNRPPHTVAGKYHDRLSRFTLDNSGVAIPGSELVLVDQTGNDTWHNGGGIFFHPTNGFLYWTDGDDQNGSNDQVITSNLFSGVFRIDVDLRGGSVSHPIPKQPANGFTGNYYIPNSNPFVGQPGVLEEFFCLGLRSPHRMTYDPPTDRIYIGDVGESSREEVDIIEPGESGLNFQWNRIEGLQGDLTPPYSGINRRPVLDYPHTDGHAVVGGYVYRGAQFADDLGGKFIFGDNVVRTVWAMNESTIPATKIPLCTLPKGAGPNSGSDYTGLSSFGIDQSNELYMCQMSSVGGQIYKLARGGSPPATRPFPLLLSQTGAFSDLVSLTASAGLVPYTVNSPLWSDGAVKTRWIALPTNTSIGFATNGEWTFPTGTVFVKHFELTTNETIPNALRRLETRLLVRDTNGAVYGGSYRWRPDYSDADLIQNGTNELISITTASGTRAQQWFYPGRQDCLSCHTTVSGGVLGVKTRQLNGDFNYAATGITDNQIRTWNHIGMFSNAVSEAAIPGFTKLAAVTDTNATLEWRARSFLDANCSQCHRPNGGVLAQFDARIDTPLSSQGLLNATPLDPMGIPGAKIIAPGDISKSILYLRDNSLDANEMPPLARNVIDTNAMALLAAWINALPPPSIPLPWLHGDIGSVGIPGDASLAGGQFTVSGGGSDIWNSADAFHYLYRPLNGDGEIIARVVSVQGTDGWAKAGVMIRETLSAGSRQAYSLISFTNGAAFQRRASTGGASTSTSGPVIHAPYWVRLTRASNLFTAYSSSNGTSWAAIGSTNISMTNKVFAGLAVTAHNNSFLNTSVFDNVSGNFGSNTAPFITWLTPTNNSTYVQPRAIALSASAGDPDGTVSQVQFFSGTNLIGTSPGGGTANLNWSNVPPGTYSLSAQAMDDMGATAQSGSVNLLVTPLTLNASFIAPTNGQFRLSFQGQNDQSYIIETSVDLKNWTPVFTNFPTNGLFEFIDTNANGSQRFYRVRE